ncbi:MAG: hypothetical protein M3Y87_21090 [Myxococcota bacterium]|nr:hypothetical protein [Myxococcota bacterium]
MSNQVSLQLLFAGLGFVILAPLWIGLFSFLQYQRRKLRVRATSLGDAPPTDHLAALGALATLRGHEDPNGPLGRPLVDDLRRSERDAIRALLFLNLVYHYAVALMLTPITLGWLRGVVVPLLANLTR